MLYSWICSSNNLGAEGRRDGDRGSGIRALRAKDKGRGPRVKQHKHPFPVLLTRTKTLAENLLTSKFY